MAQFNYKTKLDEGQIRLLKLEWGEPKSELVGRLLTRTLDVEQVEYDSSINQPRITRQKGSAPEAEQYEALSYPWGKNLQEDARIMIYVGDDSEPRPFNIKRNLEAALQLFASHIQRPTTSRFMWIDALCINQNDREEKSKQIPLMAEIYNRAHNVCVWLGDPTPNSDIAMEFIKSVIELYEFDRLVETADNSAQWQALCDLLKRRWFDRRWIVQELALARKASLYCGSKHVSWENFADAVSLFASRHESLRQIMAIIQTA